MGHSAGGLGEEGLWPPEQMLCSEPSGVLRGKVLSLGAQTPQIGVILAYCLLWAATSYSGGKPMSDRFKQYVTEGVMEEFVTREVLTYK